MIKLFYKSFNNLCIHPKLGTIRKDFTYKNVRFLKVHKHYLVVYNFDKENKVGLMFESPMSVVKGKSTLTYSTGRDSYSDTAYLSQYKSSLKPEAKEYDLGMYFKSKPKEDLSLAGKIQARFNADGEKGLVDYVGVVGVQYNF